MIICGNKNTLAKDECWKSLIKFYEDQKVLVNGETINDINILIPEQPNNSERINNDQASPELGLNRSQIQHRYSRTKYEVIYLRKN